jgi:hypothetical protein
MKMQLIKSYKKPSTITDANGLPVLDTVTGRPLTKLRTMFRYAVVDATPKELAMYKRFRNQDGVDYYREAKLKDGRTVPVYISSEYHGNSVTIDAYDREDGRVGFSVDTTDTDIYASLAEQNPAQAAALQAVVVQMKLADKRAELFNDESTVSEEDNKAFDTEPAGADDDAEENEE